MKADETLKTINKMQDLCVQIEQDNQKIEDFKAFLMEARSRHDQLLGFYHAEWAELLYDENGDTRQRIEEILKQHLQHIPEGHYSITDQDTIWDALSDHRYMLLDLLKTLTPMID